MIKIDYTKVMKKNLKNVLKAKKSEMFHQGLAQLCNNESIYLKQN